MVNSFHKATSCVLVEEHTYQVEVASSPQPELLLLLLFLGRASLPSSINDRIDHATDAT